MLSWGHTWIKGAQVAEEGQNLRSDMVVSRSSGSQEELMVSRCCAIPRHMSQEAGREQWILVPAYCYKLGTAICLCNCFPGMGQQAQQDLPPEGQCRSPSQGSLKFGILKLRHVPEIKSWPHAGKTNRMM